jgi:hypothetical protein
MQKFLVVMPSLALLLSACGSAPGETADADAAPDAPAVPAGPGSAGDPCDFPHDTLVEPRDGAELALALAEAVPGTMIKLRPGTYAGNFVAARAGAAGSEIVVCGTDESVLDGRSVGSGYVFHLDGADHWVLSGFMLTNGKKGIVLDEADHVLLTGLLIQDIGEEAVHFRSFSSDNVLSHSTIRDTGLVEPGYGEGAYIGSAINHWSSSSTPDRSDRNQVLYNFFGPNIAAEHIDIKEGTTGGLVRGNVFDGRGISGANSADSWMDVKGNGWRIEDNRGTDTLLDGFQVHARVAGWGNDNVFARNSAAANSAGYGFMVDDGTDGNEIGCDNVASGAQRGLANVACIGAGAELPPPVGSLLDPLLPPSRNFDLSHWKLTIPSGQDIQADVLNDGYTLANAFYTDPVTGGMVFRCPNLAGTTANTSYSRTELREMLAPAGSASADANNWTTADGGTLRAKLRVDRVSVSGDDAKVGRVIIGQIHGDDSEPIRLYFHKKPGEAKGRIYAAHDTADNQNSYSPDIVGNTDGAGIALGETFDYEIRLVDTRLTVVIERASGATETYTKDIDPAYRGENLYFKAGVYNQNNTGESGDYVQATFFALSQTH